MEIYKKIRFPRKIKKKLKKIPYAGFCYGGSMGDKGKIVNDRRVYKRHYCPFRHGAHCSLINNTVPKDRDDWSYQEHAIEDQTAICKHDSKLVMAFIQHHFQIHKVQKEKVFEILGDPSRTYYYEQRVEEIPGNPPKKRYYYVLTKKV